MHNNIQKNLQRFTGFSIRNHHVGVLGSNPTWFTIINIISVEGHVTPSSTGFVHVPCVGWRSFPSTTVTYTRKQLWHLYDRIQEGDSLPTP